MAYDVDFEKELAEDIEEFENELRYENDLVSNIRVINLPHGTFTLAALHIQYIGNIQLVFEFANLITSDNITHILMSCMTISYPTVNIDFNGIMIPVKNIHTCIFFALLYDDIHIESHKIIINLNFMLSQVKALTPYITIYFSIIADIFEQCKVCINIDESNKKYMKPFSSNIKLIKNQDMFISTDCLPMYFTNKIIYGPQYGRDSLHSFTFTLMRFMDDYTNPIQQIELHYSHIENGERTYQIKECTYEPIIINNIEIIKISYDAEIDVEMVTAPTLFITLNEYMCNPDYEENSDINTFLASHSNQALICIFEYYKLYDVKTYKKNIKDIAQFGYLDDVLI